VAPPAAATAAKAEEGGAIEGEEERWGKWSLLIWGKRKREK